MDQNPFSSTPPSTASGENPPGDPVLPAVSIPDHELLRCIGRGSYGEVWLARNMMGLFRAVKIVYRKSFDNQRPFDRELSGIQKFEPLSRSHEGFVDVLHVGIKPGEYFYYIMELGDDEASGQNIQPGQYSPRTLAKSMEAEGRLTFDQCLKLGIALSQALAELHKHHLVHRDVKPSNIIFVNGVPKLADIGLVANTGEARSYVGTEGFIPPEGPGAPNADVYSLGKVLYECSTGKDRHDFPELPTLLDQFPDQDKLLELNEVILHACKADPADRYQTAWEMYSDLLVLANGNSVRRLKLLERRLATGKKVVGFSLAALVIIGVVLAQLYRERRAFLQERQRQIGANVAYGNSAVDAGDSLGALPYFAEALKLNQNAATSQDDRLRFASTLAHSPVLAQMWFFPDMVYGARFHPDGRRMLVSQVSGQAQLFDLLTRQPASPRFGPTNNLRGCSFSPDGRLVAAANEDSAAHVYRSEDGVELLQLEHPGPVFCTAFSPDGRHLATGCSDGVVRIWNLDSKEVERQFIGHQRNVLWVTFSHHGRWVASAGEDGNAFVWELATGQPFCPPFKHSSWVNHVSFSPDDAELATSSFDRKAHVWELASHREILPAMAHDDGIITVEFSPDGQRIATAGYDRILRLWSREGHEPDPYSPVFRFPDRVTFVTFASDGHRMLATCADGSVRLWDLAGCDVTSEPSRDVLSSAGRFRAATNEHGLQVQGMLSHSPPPAQLTDSLPDKLFFSGQENLLVTAKKLEGTNFLQSVKIFDVLKGRSLAPPFSIVQTFTNLALSPSGRLLLAWGGRYAQMWSVEDGQPASPLMMIDPPIAGAAFNPDGTRFAWWHTNQVEIRDSVTGMPCFPPLAHETFVKGAAFSPDGRSLLTYSSDGYFTKCSARIWDAATGGPTGMPIQHEDGVLFATFSPDGQRIVTASEDYTAGIWDAKTGRQLTPLLKHKNQVRGAAFSPDGNWIVTAAGSDARIWSAATGEPLTPPLRQAAMLSKACFAFDRRSLLTWDVSQAVRTWRLPTTEDSLDQLQRLAFLLNGGTVTPVGAAGTIPPDASKSIWDSLQTNRLAHTQITPGQIKAWHAFQIESYEFKKNWPVRDFHTRQLAALSEAGRHDPLKPLEPSADPGKADSARK
ncbi:MAG: protein kinase [Verrucomicrobiota bacterium]